ncbi:CLUMA_CG021666, isoform A [Clunio marinus]|uniref:CLUMA_CG021666, isoform A n=1 Tax=Clunio marinus TaxID=568069 RepID=A0A1J1J8H0_9DIPT|nr:CLUMA_CG021666, isoform A [Clunio marinus]
MKAIKEAIDMHIETRKTIRKDSSKRQPMRKKNVKKFEKFEAELMSPSEKKNNFDKIFYGQNTSMTNIEQIGRRKSDNNGGCFEAASRRILKRKHSEVEKKSFIETIKEKFGFKIEEEAANQPQRSILTSNVRNKKGENNFSYQHDDFNSFDIVTNNVECCDVDEHELQQPPRKRVKFDEKNLIISSITYQRQQRKQSEDDNLRMKHFYNNKKSFFSKFIDFTANLF